MYSVKEIAQLQGCSETIIYRHIRNHKELKEHTTKSHNRTMISEQGFQLIRDLMQETAPVVVSEASDLKLIEELKAELQAKQNKIEDLQGALIGLNNDFRELLNENHKLKLQEAETKLLEAQNKTIEQENRDLKEQLAFEKLGFFAKRKALKQQAKELNSDVK